MIGKIKQKVWLFVYYIFNFIKVKLMSRLLSKSIRRYSDKWEMVRNDYEKYATENILIIGNGPSLSIMDLESVNRIPSIASNKIYLLFEKSNWRPDFVTICDTLLAYKLRNEKFKTIDRLICSDVIFYLLKSAGKKRLPWKNITLESAWEKYVNNKVFTPDPLSEGFFEGYSITNQNIQLAMWLGAKKIYLIGVDHFYQEARIDKAGAKMIHEGQNHFHPDYRKSGEIVNNAPVDKMNDAYEKMNAIAKASGVEIINISRRTALTAFKTMNTDEAIRVINQE